MGCTNSTKQERHSKRVETLLGISRRLPLGRIFGKIIAKMELRDTFGQSEVSLVSDCPLEQKSHLCLVVYQIANR